MSVYMKMFVWPTPEKLLDHHGFERLLKHLLRERIVTLPGAVLTGTFSADHTFALIDQSYIDGQWQQVPISIVGADEPDIAVAYQGYSDDDLLATFRNLPWGDTDICICFAAFDWTNEALVKSLEAIGGHNAYVWLCALRQPRTAIIFDCYGEPDQAPEREIQQAFVSWGNRGPATIAGTLLEPLLTEAFGEHLMIDCAFG